MSQNLHIRTIVANDNAPAQKVPMGDAVGFHAMLRQRQYERSVSENTEQSTTINSPLKFWGLLVSSLIWLGFLGGLGWAFYTGQSVNSRIFMTIGMIWSGLWIRFLSMNDDYDRLAEAGLLTSLMGFGVLMIIAATQLGYPMSLAGGLFAFTVCALLVSWINHSKISLIAATAACLLWAALQHDGYMSSGSYSYFVPVLCALAILQSTRLNFLFGIVLTLVVGSVWLVGSSVQAYAANELGSLYILAGALVIGTLIYRAAKAGRDSGKPYLEFAVVLGWAIATVSLVAIAHFGSDPSHPVWERAMSTGPFAKIIWAIILLSATAVIWMAGMVRRKYKRMSLAGVCLTTLLAATIPFAIWFESDLALIFQDLTAMSFYPNIGYFLFGAVIGNILFFMANSYRQEKYGQLTTAIGVAFITALAMREFDFLHNDGYAICVLGGLAALAIKLVSLEPQLHSDSHHDERRSVSSS